MSVIFFYRVKIKRRHFLVSAVMPYVFIFLGLGLLVTTVVSGMFQFIGAQYITFLGQPRSLGPLAGFDTPMIAAYSPENRAIQRGRVPLGRLAQAEEIASVGTFLISDDARYINGETIIVDGGAAFG